MKYCKIKINKIRGATTKFVYPESYDSNIFKPVCYENKGNDIEYCVALVDDTFDLTQDGFEEIDKATAESLIEDYVNNDKDITRYDNTMYDSLQDLKDSVILKRKSLL